MLSKGLAIAYPFVVWLHMRAEFYAPQNMSPIMLHFHVNASDEGFLILCDCNNSVQ